jgi:hypothetical protein
VQERGAQTREMFDVAVIARLDNAAALALRVFLHSPQQSACAEAVAG